MAIIKTYKDLIVYQKSLVLLDRLYDIAYQVPHQKLRTQLTNAGEAIAPLIGEGFSRKHNPNDAARYFEMAMGESDEVPIHFEKAIILAKRFPRINIQECNALINEYNILAKQLNKLVVAWRKLGSS